MSEAQDYQNAVQLAYPLSMATCLEWLMQLTGHQAKSM
jgi:hypothetical protein